MPDVYELLADVRRRLMRAIEGSATYPDKLMLGDRSKYPEGKYPGEVVLHGTHAKNVESILKNGLQVKRADTTNRGYLYVTTDSKVAKYYAEKYRESGKNAVIIKLVVPPAALNNFTSNVGSVDASVEYKSKEDIPPDWIVDVLDAKGKSIGKRYGLSDRNGTEMYVAVSIDEDTELAGQQ